MEKSMSNGIKVTKRDGNIQSLDLEKMHIMVAEACEGLTGVSASQIEMQSGIQFYDGISTSEIQEILIRSASDLISLDNPNYQYAAARLLLFTIRKQVFGRIKEFPTLSRHTMGGIDNGIYDSDLIKKYNHAEYNE